MSVGSRPPWIREINLSERETELIQRCSQQLGLQAHNTSTRDVEVGVLRLGRERNIKWEETGAQVQSKDLQRQKFPVWSEHWLL